MKKLPNDYEKFKDTIWQPIKIEGKEPLLWDDSHHVIRIDKVLYLANNEVFFRYSYHPSSINPPPKCNQKEYSQICKYRRTRVPGFTELKLCKQQFDRPAIEIFKGAKPLNEKDRK